MQQQMMNRANQPQPYQPVGFVQSQYGQQQQNPQSFHHATYRGNQPGHDQYLRSDSEQPSSFAQRPYPSQFQQRIQPQYQPQQTQFRPQFQQQQSYQPTGFVQSQYGQQQQNPQSFHLATYRGNQPGHDQYLRSDSEQPSSFVQRSFQPQFQQRTQPQYQPQQTQLTPQFQQQSYQPVGFVQSQYGQQQQNPQSFHQTNYRGNQPGHDQYLRSDSEQPSNQPLMH